MTSCTPAISSSDPESTSPLLPVMPMAVRCAPGMEWARYPSASIFWQTARTCSSLACAFITTSMCLPRTISLAFAAELGKQRAADVRKDARANECFRPRVGWGYL